MNSRSGADQTTEVDRQYSFVETGSSHPLPPSTDDRYENGERAYKINGRTTALAEYLPADTTTQTAVVPWKLPLKARRVEGPKWVDYGRSRHGAGSVPAVFNEAGRGSRTCLYKSRRSTALRL